jgi:acetylornithine deacetylase/succinyl-diaminopimelate desuccinylase-like protein
MTTLSDLKAWYEKHAKEIQQDYFTFLKFPSISTDPNFKKHIQETAHWVEAYLKKIGFKTQVWETIGHPVVFATHLVDDSRPTVLIYHHYDVQPVDPIDKWKTPPFEPTIRDGQVYARGASDNKGQCFYTMTALKALFELCKKVNVNIKLFIEGEEESSSKGAMEVLKTKRDLLKADYVLVVDAGLPAPNTPAITMGLRGIVAMEATCKNSSIDLHSGLHGGIVLNPNRALIQMLAQLWDKNGKVTVPGFYDSVEDNRSQDTEDVDRAYLQKQFGIKAFQGEGGYTLLESNTIRPTLEINGISGGYTGEGFKTVIPSMARAKISCRLVPHQDPERIAEQISSYLKKIAPAGLEIEVKWDHGGKAVRTSSDTKIAHICCEAFSEVFGKPCREILCGASIPLVVELGEACGGEVAVMGVALDSDDIHAPNEHFGLDQFRQGFLTMASILGRLAK